MDFGKRFCFLLFLAQHSLFNRGTCVYVDPGVPYVNGPLEVGELTVTVTMSASPKHVKVYFPLEAGDYAVVYFVGGLASYVPAEAYTTFLSKVAAHGYFVFGVDYAFPLNGRHSNLGQDLDKYFQELQFLQTYMRDKTPAVAQWNNTGLLCHSAGCDITLKMIEANKVTFRSTAFLEPFSELVKTSSNLTITVPGLMYAAQLAFEGVPSCNIAGFGFNRYYDLWRCPRIALEVADFGHCDILDPVFWEVCHLTHFCKTTDDKRLDHYRQSVHGIVTSFFGATLQGRPDVINYINDVTNIPLKIMESKVDWKC